MNGVASHMSTDSAMKMPGASWFMSTHGTSPSSKKYAARPSAPSSSSTWNHLTQVLGDCALSWCLPLIAVVVGGACLFGGAKKTNLVGGALCGKVALHKRCVLLALAHTCRRGYHARQADNWEQGKRHVAHAQTQAAKVHEVNGKAVAAAAAAHAAVNAAVAGAAGHVSGCRCPVHGQHRCSSWSFLRTVLPSFCFVIFQIKMVS